MNTGQQVVVMVFGAILAVTGIYLFATGKAKGKNKIVIVGVTVELSTPSLIIFVVGCGLFISPFFIGQKTPAPIAKGETNPVAVSTPEPTNRRIAQVSQPTNERVRQVSSSAGSDFMKKVQEEQNAGILVPESIRFYRCLFLEDANLLVISGIGRSVTAGETNNESFIMTSDNRGETFALSRVGGLDLGRAAGAELCGSRDGRYVYAASLGPDGRVLVSRNKGQSWDVRRLPQETSIRDVSCSADGRCVWTACASSNAFLSMNFGETWILARMGETFAPIGCVLVSADGGEIWLGGGDITRPFVRHSRDNGRNWDNTFFDSMVGLSGRVSNFGAVRRIATAGDGAWALVYEGNTNRIVSRMLSRSGYRWVDLPGSPYMTDLFVTGTGRKLFGASRDGISISVDGGIRWETRTLPEPVRAVPEHPGRKLPKLLFGICGSRDGNTVWAVGAPGWIVRSTDGGQNWNLLKF